MTARTLRRGSLAAALGLLTGAAPASVLALSANGQPTATHQAQASMSARSANGQPTATRQAEAGLGGTGTGHSGWEWSDPSPQGENLRAVAFAAGTGYAAGDDGAVLRSVDGGATWTALSARTTTPLTRVSAPSAGVVAVAGGCVVRVSTDAGTTMGRVAVSGSDRVCAAPVAAVSFTDGVNGLVVLADGSVLATADGGRSFARRTSVPGTPSAGGPAQVGDVVLRSPTVAFALAGPSVYRSTDGGASWTAVGTAPVMPGAPSPGTLTGLAFTGTAGGVAVGSEGTLLTTADAGATWTPLMAGQARLPLRSVACGSPATCLVTVDNSGDTLRLDTVTPTVARVTPSSTPLHGVTFASDTRAVAVGDGGTVVLSDDAGQTWRSASSRVVRDVTGLVAQPFGSAFALGASGGLVRTDDGDTWRSTPVPAAGQLVSVAFRTPQAGFALDTTGTVLRTANGGASWDILDTGTGDLPHTVLAVGATRVLAIGPRTVRRSTDNGTTFTTAALPLPRGVTTTGASRAGTGVMAWGRTRVLLSGDGRTWSALSLPRVRGTRAAVRDAACVSLRACWLVTAGGRVLTTADAGASWTDVTLAAGRPRVARLSAASARRAYLVLARPFGSDTGQGWVLATTDGGRTWAPQRVSPYAVRAVSSAASVDYALDSAGRIFRTRTAGATATATRLTLTARPASIRRATSVVVQGRLSPAGGGEEVVVTTSSGLSRTATVASSGRFSVSLRMTSTTGVVAQWGGDGSRSSVGSAVLTVRRR